MNSPQSDYAPSPAESDVTVRRDVIVIGASAGGVEALVALFKDLPGRLSAAMFVVLHTTPTGYSRLPDILSRQTNLSAHFAQDQEKVNLGTVYVAPTNRHLMLQDRKVLVTTAPRENRNRPAINPLFRTAAEAYGSRVIGVVLTGLLDDGTAGLWEIKRRGGIAVVQAPEDAAYPQMPANAIANVDVDHIVAIREMAALLVSLCRCEAEL